MALVTLGDDAVRPGNLARAIEILEEGLAHVRAAGDNGLAGVGLGILGTALRLQGDLDAATAVLEDGVALSRSVENTWGVALALQDLAQVARERGEARRAAALFAECLAVAREIWDRRRIAECLEGFAELATERGENERAAWLLGAAQALRDATGSAVEPVDRSIYDRSTAAVHQALGESGFTAAWDAGRSAPLDQALNEAAAQSGKTDVAGESSTQLAREDPLTTREREVARLIARGLTNPQIGEQLVISRRTADRHVSNILDKLGFATRAQVAVWAVERAGAAIRG
jgi:ATP/maltotriose-dependent transcriptional regulator MalT